ncbi:hypothetical protein HDV05_004766 [Chytridiales sp. JEL 0842]|nr:hypothetical protein HDV05_004766 [Chytridiales sp. JEL 0842]
MAMFGIGGFAALFFTFKMYRSLQPKDYTIKYESKEEEDYVKRYIAHAKKEAHKPLLVREAYGGPSGAN